LRWWASLSMPAAIIMILKAMSRNAAAQDPSKEDAPLRAYIFVALVTVLFGVSLVVGIIVPIAWLFGIA
jgi:hypothetical protein